MLHEGEAVLLRVVDLFCGVGGLAYGLKSAGLDVAAGVDLDVNCEFPFEENCTAEFVQRDIRLVSPADLQVWFGDADIRILAGCAPCQPFSTYSQTRKSPDERWQLLRAFQDLAIDASPEIVTMENVTRLAFQPVWRDFINALQQADYHVTWREVACTDFGVPQSRKRLVLLASRFGPIELTAAIQNTGDVTVRNAIGHMPAIAAGESNRSDRLHTASSLSTTNLARIRASRPGSTWRDWPFELRAMCHTKEGGETYPSVYGRMEWDRPAPTITTQFYGFGSGRFGHPEQDRAISIREAALLQSFPNEYKFLKPDQKVTFRRLGILIGNAVPPKLGAAIGATISQHVASRCGRFISV